MTDTEYMQNLLLPPDPSADSRPCMGAARHYAEQTIFDHVMDSSDLDYREFMVSLVLLPMLAKLENQQELSILTIEMTNFDLTEAAHSRHAADHVMIKMAHTMRAELGGDELVARLLDRKLMIVSSGTTGAFSAVKLAEQMEQICARSVFRFGLTFQPAITWAACSTEQHLTDSLGLAHSSELAADVEAA